MLTKKITSLSKALKREEEPEAIVNKQEVVRKSFVKKRTQLQNQFQAIQIDHPSENEFGQFLAIPSASSPSPRNVVAKEGPSQETQQLILQKLEELLQQKPPAIE